MDRDFELDSLTPAERDALLNHCQLLPSTAESKEGWKEFLCYLWWTGGFRDDGGPGPASVVLLDQVRQLLGEDGD